LVSADLATVPSGYVLTSPAITEVKLPYQKNIDFGFTAQSGIYGIVYFDNNHDHKPDEGDEFIQKAKIILDNHIIEVSDYDGTYFFKNVSSGTHTLQIDVNSLPLEYLPLVKLSTAVEITEGTVYVFHVPLSKKNIPDN
jgi:YbbR domain-containing protein